MSNTQTVKGPLRIRLKYAGLMVFSLKVFSIVTGSIFTFIVVRKLSSGEFGLWQTIGALMTYFILPSRVFTYWLIRDEARGLPAAKTGLLINIILAFFFFTLFIPIALHMAAEVHAELLPFLMFSFQIPLIYVVSSLEAMGQATRPQAIGYGTGVFELAKLILCVVLVLVFKYGLVGVITSVTLAYLIQILVLTLILGSSLSTHFNFNLLKKWITLIWIPLYWELSGAFYPLTFLVLALLTKSTLPVALMGAPAIISNVVPHTSFLAAGLYPRLLSGGGREDVEEAFKLVSMFAIPITIGIIILARPLLQLLRPEYVIAAPILGVLAIRSLLKTIGGIAENTLLGVEKIELDGKSKLKDYIKSKHFFLPTLTSINSLLSILLLISFLVLYATSAKAKYEWLIFTYLFVDLVVIKVPMHLYVWTLVGKTLSFRFPKLSIIKYLASAAAMSLLLMVLHALGVPNAGKSLIESFLALLFTISLGFAVYVLTLLAIDKEARRLTTLIKKEVIKLFKL